jgi:hypothetical protein
MARPARRQKSSSFEGWQIYLKLALCVGFLEVVEAANKGSQAWFALLDCRSSMTITLWVEAD